MEVTAIEHFARKRGLRTGSSLCMAVWSLCLCTSVHAQLQLYTPIAPIPIFAGQDHRFDMEWRNSGLEMQADITYRVYDGTGTNSLLMQGKWKKLHLLKDQRAMEYFTINFPPVEKPTLRILNFYWGINNVGTQPLHLYPTNILRALATDLANASVGVIEEGNVYGPLLRANGIAATNMTILPSDFSGRLLIWTGDAFGPERTKLTDAAARGVAILWLVNEFRPWAQPIRPSYYLLPQTKGAIVVAQPTFFPDLRSNPVSQLRLQHCCRLALKPEPMKLPSNNQ